MKIKINKDTARPKL